MGLLPQETFVLLPQDNTPLLHYVLSIFLRIMCFGFMLPQSFCCSQNDTEKEIGINVRGCGGGEPKTRVKFRSELEDALYK